MVMLILIFVLIFVFALALYKIFYLLFHKRFITVRLLGMRKNIRLDKTVESRMVTKKVTVKSMGMIPGLEKYLSEASITMEPSKFLYISSLASFICPSLLFILTFSIWISIAAFLAIPCMICLYLNHSKKKRIKLFLSQLPDIVNFLSNSLKSGFSLMQALNMIAEEGSPPSSSEFNRVLQDINLGKTYEDAFDRMIERNKAEDIEILVTGILISKETGGNLSHILDTVAGTIREKEKINGEVRALTSQGRLSGLIMTLLPIAVFAILALMNPGYVKPLFTQPLGKIMLVCGIGSQSIGAFLISKIVKVKR